MALVLFQTVSAPVCSFFSRRQVCDSRRRFVGSTRSSMCAKAHRHTAPSPQMPSAEDVSLSAYGYKVLRAKEPLMKVRLTNEAAAQWKLVRRVGSVLGSSAVPASPARPELPAIVKPSDMPTMKQASKNGTSRSVYLLHGLAHVELNAIDLAWDTCLRFGDGMPDEWFEDFLSIAVDESRHFGWLATRLEELGSSYGALPAHRIVWDAADVSRTSRRERLAVGQLCQEARGLDAGPRLADRLVGSGDLQSASIIRQIAEEEVAHVSIGVKHFLNECERSHPDGLASAITLFHEIALRLSNRGAFAPPFNEDRRRQAGLDPEWYIPVAEEMQNGVKSRGEKVCS